MAFILCQLSVTAVSGAALRGEAFTEVSRWIVGVLGVASPLCAASADSISPATHNVSLLNIPSLAELSDYEYHATTSQLSRSFPFFRFLRFTCFSLLSREDDEVLEDVPCV